MHQPCEPLPALGLQGFGLGQSIVGTWVNSRLAATWRPQGVGRWLIWSRCVRCRRRQWAP